MLVAIDIVYCLVSQICGDGIGKFVNVSQNVDFSRLGYFLILLKECIVETLSFNTWCCCCFSWC